MRKMLVLLLALLALTLNATQARAASASEQEKIGEYLKDLGLIYGDKNGELKTTNTLSRAEAVVIISRIIDEEEDSEGSYIEGNPFIDIEADAWYASSVLRAKRLGIVSGISENQFDPNGKVSIKQISSMFLAAGGYTADWWTEDIIEKAKHYGLLKGLNFSDENIPCTRGQAFQVFANAIEIPMNPSNNDMCCVLSTLMSEKDVLVSLEVKYPKLKMFMPKTYQPDYTFLERMDFSK